ISFTGSEQTGSHVASECGKQLKKVSLEMGGKNAIIVMDDADLDLAVEGIVWSAFGTSGQRCTACSRIIVHENVKEEVEKKLLSEMEKLSIGDGLDESNKVGPIINQQGVDKINYYIEVGKNGGDRLLDCGVELTKGSYENGDHFAAIFLSVASDDIGRAHV